MRAGEGQRSQPRRSTAAGSSVSPPGVTFLSQIAVTLALSRTSIAPQGVSMFRKSIQALAFTAPLAIAAGCLPALAAEITGAGATFPAPIYAKWADAYQKASGTTVTYQSVGSGAGIKQIQAKTVDFGA